MGEQRIKTCLITGCGGFIGSYLAELLLEQGWQVYGTVHRNTRNIRHLQQKVSLTELDMTDHAQVHALVCHSKPHTVFHLASQSYIGPSWQNPVETFRTNIFGTIYLFEAIQASKLDPVVVVVGSSAEYGHAQSGGGQISEETPFHPSSPYAVSKITQDMLGYMYWRRYGLRIVRVRPFALIGPRKDTDAVSDFARGIVRIERKESDSLSVGDVEAIRDFLDVRDGVKALVHLAEHGIPGEVYNLCSGKGSRLRDILDELMALAGIPVKVTQDPERVRSSDDPILIGDNSKLQRLGWKPVIPLHQTLRDTIEFWRIAHPDYRQLQ